MLDWTSPASARRYRGVPTPVLDFEDFGKATCPLRHASFSGRSWTKALDFAAEPYDEDEEPMAGADFFVEKKEMPTGYLVNVGSTGFVDVQQAELLINYLILGSGLPDNTTAVGWLVPRQLALPNEQLARFGFFHPTSPLGGWPAISENILKMLGRLKDGWAGPGSRRPSEDVLKNLQAVVSLLPGDTKGPDVDVDEEDGDVTLRWWSQGKERTFSLVFTGNDHVIGVHSGSTQQEPAMKIPVSDVAKLISMLTAEPTIDIIQVG
jgi:hypothetical protein